ncbi:protoheme IX farnesyltransferase, partial [Mesorhizobium sp. M6A.T.Ca.TU.002.02.2.1]
AWKLLVDKRRVEGWEMKRAKALFAYSIFYLFAIFAVLLADTIVLRAVMSAGN